MTLTQAAPQPARTSFADLTPDELVARAEAIALPVHRSAVVPGHLTRFDGGGFLVGPALVIAARGAFDRYQDPLQRPVIRRTHRKGASR